MGIQGEGGEAQHRARLDGEYRDEKEKNDNFGNASGKLLTVP